MVAQVMSNTTAGVHAGISPELRDFTTTPRVGLISALALLIGSLSAFVSLALLRLIGLFTNLFFFGRWNAALVSPAGNHLGVWAALVPVAGALVIGLMARYGSERIRGHGIPEAIEAILINGSRIEPRVAILKPISSAISIGSGGPFGAEGPIIMTGGAFGSMIAQFLHLTSAERKTLLVAGAAGGMSATFAAPLASVALAVELLLFEWKPRSLVPVALASGAAALWRQYLLGPGPLFPMTSHVGWIPPAVVVGAAAAGLAAGCLSVLLTLAVYAAEDAFHRLPIHWMWWPAIGGLVVGLGGLVFPQALGVGYDVIGALLQGRGTGALLAGILAVKSVIWSVSLGSGTSGGVLAPLLLIGGALGAVAAPVLPAQGPGFWPLITMGAVLGGTMRSPLTGVVFAVELTQNVGAILPLLVAVVVAHGLTVLVMGRSILTEKVSRRGYHLSREYSVDPLEILFVREVMRPSVAVIPAWLTAREAVAALEPHLAGRQRLFPVVDDRERLVGVMTRQDVTGLRNGAPTDTPIAAFQQPVVACYPDENLRTVVQRMAETGLTRFPVVDRNDGRLLGLLALRDLLTARARNLEAERRRERVLRIRLRLPPRSRRPQGVPS
jgi:chloride channel protein, CIC family